MKTIVVTGANGQLGKCIAKIKDRYPEYRFVLTCSTTLDITDNADITRVFETVKPDYCINCAAYTDVIRAEREPQRAFLINSKGVKYLAAACEKYATILIHISTDYVFDGTKSTPYTVTDIPKPINAYGRSKWAGECYLKRQWPHHFIIRTSWLYSEFGKNFYTLILEKAQLQKEIYVTDQQKGTPTDAHDLALFLMKIIASEYKKYGTYHFCGNTIMTWYDFAISILKENDKHEQVTVIRTENYSTFVKRPVYSALASSVLLFD